MRFTSKQLLCLILSAVAAPAFGALTDPFSLEDLLGVKITDVPTMMPSETPTESPAPSPAPSAAPSEAPTESPAPSPAPSAAPTETPTGTNPPTGKPTEAPTESPAPSPSPSDFPTEFPTQNPSAHPTNSPSFTPQPTTSPSAYPSDIPSDMPSEMPSVRPTTSPAPSSGPTSAPTKAPSGSPTLSPTMQPSVSAAPSSIPSDAPSNVPTDQPSHSPTDHPTDLPSHSPTTSPSAAPSSAPITPSSSPSSAPTVYETKAPSPSPTESEFRTKTQITDVLLVGIPRTMEDSALARFEIETLEFIRDTQPETEGFKIDMLAVTVLTETVVYTDSEIGDHVHDGDRRRKLQDADTALQVHFRTVGVVTQGVAPADLNFADITDEGFRHHFNQYLYRLASVDDFFKPLQLLVADELAVDENAGEETRNKGQFIAAIFLSTIAFTVALFASYYSIKKHLRNQSRIKDKGRMLEYPGYGGKNVTQTFSDSDETTDRHGDAKPLQLDISYANDDLEDVGLSPSGLASPFHGCTPIPEEREPLSPSTLGADESKPSSFGRFSETSASIKKWLTPRLSAFNSEQQEDSSTVTPSRSDPPDARMPAATAGKSDRNSMEPAAAITSTANKNGLLTGREKNIIGDSQNAKKKSEYSPVTIPMSFFSQDADGISEASGTPMGSLAGSTASSFFMKMGKSVFTGRKSMQSEAGASEVGKGSEAGASDVQPTCNFGSTRGGTNAYQSKNTENNNKAPRATNAASNAAARSDKKATMSSMPPPKPTVNRKVPRPQKIQTQRPGDSPGTDEDAPPTRKSEKTLNKSNVQKANAEKKASAPAPKRSVEPYQDNEMYDDPETPSKRSRNGDSVYSEQSELELNEFNMNTLGARAPSSVARPPSFHDQGSFIGHDYDQRLGFRPPSTIGSRSQISYNTMSTNHNGSGGNKFPPSNINAMGNDSRSNNNNNFNNNNFNNSNNANNNNNNSGNSKNNGFNLGARPMGNTEKKQYKEKSSLSSMAKREGAYDVFAPSGPIGIVVDTSNDGPAVHSLKSTSPLLGLINPGDLIIALDDEDTREMTAASLTRLMAKKSRQKERKITLFAPDGF